MTSDRRADAKRLASEIFARTLAASRTVQTFRRMAQLGLPLATTKVALQHEIMCQNFATAKEYASLFKVDRQQLADTGFFKNFATKMTDEAVVTFESASDAASLIFTHSVLDSAVLDWCRVCALVAPEDFEPYIIEKKVALSEVQEASFAELRDVAIRNHLDKLERESLIKKLNLIFLICRPPSDFVGINNYRYDNERIISLDKLRHDYVHRGGLGERLPEGDDDLLFLWDTTNFLLPLVNQRYEIQLDAALFVTEKPSEEG